MSPFGTFAKLGGVGSASVIVPGMDHRTPNSSQTTGAVNMKFGQGGADGAAAQDGGS